MFVSIAALGELYPGSSFSARLNYGICGILIGFTFFYIFTPFIFILTFIKCELFTSYHEMELLMNTQIKVTHILENFLIYQQNQIIKAKE